MAYPSSTISDTMRGTSDDHGTAGAPTSTPTGSPASRPRMWKAYYRRQPARLFGLLVQALREQARRLVAAGARREPAPDPGPPPGSPARPATTSASPRTSPAATGCSGCRDTSTSRRSPATSSAGGSSGARSGWPPARGRRLDHRPVRGALRRPARAGRGGRPAARDGGRGPRPRRDRRSGRPDGCAARPTGRRSPGCCASRIASLHEALAGGA